MRNQFWYGRDYVFAEPGTFFKRRIWERQFDLFKLWAGTFRAPSFSTAGKPLHYVWRMAVAPNIRCFTTDCPIILWNLTCLIRKRGNFFYKKRRIFEKAPFIHSVRVLAEGHFAYREEITRWIHSSHFISRAGDFLSASMQKGRCQCRNSSQTD